MKVRIVQGVLDRAPIGLEIRIGRGSVARRIPDAGRVEHQVRLSSGIGMNVEYVGTHKVSRIPAAVSTYSGIEVDDE